jgi:hypothetical protein
MPNFILTDSTPYNKTINVYGFMGPIHQIRSA